MAKPKIEYFYLRASAQGSEPRRYPSVEGVLSAMEGLLQLQLERGFVTTRDSDGKHVSRHPDGRSAQFWAENDRGDIVS
jgi:hypothetical protein